ncbi:MAG TPA: L,D-transpeptidase [Hansschlegelia sp.]
MLSRRLFVIAAPLFTAGCAGMSGSSGVQNVSLLTDPRYGEVEDNGFTIPAVDLKGFDPRFLRQEVADPTGQPVGTVVVDPSAHMLYLVLPDGKALRYGVGVGRDGFAWSGDATIARKAVWPTWTPPAEMVARDPQSAPWANGMPGGPDNPLGARALYLYQNGVDTLYRIHGTNAPHSIGKSMSSGCIRMLDQDIIDLHSRVPVGSRAVVLPARGGEV